MALPEIAKESNFKYSLRKYFYDTFPTTTLLFDQGLGSPVSPSGDPVQWLSIEFGSFIIGTLNEASINIYACARQDTDADNVTLLRDEVVGAFVETSAGSTDGIKRIPIYVNIGLVDEEIVGYMMAEILFQSGYQRAADGTKFKQLTIMFRWGSNYIEP